MSVRIVSANTADSATLSSTDFVATLPVGNLQLEGRGRVARTVNVTGDKVILGNFAGASVVSCAVLYNHNLTSQATFRLQLYAAANQTGSIVYDTGAVVALPALGWGEFGWGLTPWGGTVFSGWGSAFSDFWFTAVGALSFKITLNDAANPAGYIQVKRLLIGPYFEPAVNVEYGLQLSWQDNSTQIRTQGGSLRTDNRVLFRTLQARLSRMTTAERAVFTELVRTIGLRKETFVSVWPDAGGSLERDYALLGKFTKMPQITNPNPANYVGDIQFEEV